MNKPNGKIHPLSYRQRLALDLWFRNGRKSKARALREAGYGSSIIRQPHKVFNSPSVKRELELRGHGTDGTYNNLTPQIKTDKTVSPNIAPFDIEKIPKEQIDTLREKLAALPDILPPKDPFYSVSTPFYPNAARQNDDHKQPSNNNIYSSM